MSPRSLRSLLPILVPVILLVLVVAVGGSGVPSDAGEPPRPTTYSAASGGARAIYLVLREFLPSVERWTRPLTALAPPEGESPTTLLVMGPSSPLTAEEADALDAWVGKGGQLIMAGQGPWPISDRAGTHGSAGTTDFFARHYFRFATDRRALAEHSGEMGSLLLEGAPLRESWFRPLFDDRTGALGGVQPVGKGRIVVVSDERAWSNDRLRRSRNSAWLVRAVGGWGNGRMLVGEPGYGGQGAGAVPSRILSFLGSIWGFAFLQAGLAGLLFIVQRARRFGPLVEPPKEKLQDPMERVRGIGSMLEAARARAFSVRVISQLLSLRVRRAGRAVPAPAREEASVLSDDELIRMARRSGEILKENTHVGQQRH